MLSCEFREHAIFNTLCCFCILVVPGNQSKIVNNSDESTDEVQELRTELAKTIDKIAAMNDELAQLKETVSGE